MRHPATADVTPLPPPRHPTEHAPRPPLALNDIVLVFIAAGGWHPAFVVGVHDGMARLLIDASPRSQAFSDAFAAGFDSRGILELPCTSSRLRRTSRRR